ncbi:MAG TPA: hypothetical protein VK142_06445 [Bacillota bacterium]|nr:hypothetical protein [Bacillota bacterium]
MWLVIILVFFQSATWGTDDKAEKDEMGQHIKNNSVDTPTTDAMGFLAFNSVIWEMYFF